MLETRSTQAEPHLVCPSLQEEDPFEHPAAPAPTASAAAAASATPARRPGESAAGGARRRQSSARRSASEARPPGPVEPQPPLFSASTVLVSEVTMAAPLHCPSWQ